MTSNITLICGKIAFTTSPLIPNLEPCDFYLLTSYTTRIPPSQSPLIYPHHWFAQSHLICIISTYRILRQHLRQEIFTDPSREATITFIDRAQLYALLTLASLVAFALRVYSSTSLANKTKLFFSPFWWAQHDLFHLLDRRFRHPRFSDASIYALPPQAPTLLFDLSCPSPSPPFFFGINLSHAVRTAFYNALTFS